MSIAYFPRLYEDELLFSVFSRFYRHGGYLSFKDAAKELFINPKLRIEKEFVKNLKPEIIKLLTQDITLDNLLEKHTMYPFYGRFINPEKRKMAYKALVSMEGDFSKLFGVPQLRNGEQRFIRYCPKCVIEDRQRYGETYWHRFPQMRNTHLCAKHGCYLLNSMISLDSRIPVNFMSAEEVIAEDDILAGQIKDCNTPLEWKVAKYMVEVFQMPMNENGNSVEDFLRQKLIGTPYISSRGEHNYFHKLWEDMQVFYEDISDVKDITDGQVQRTLKGNRTIFSEICMIAMFLNISTVELANMEVCPKLPQQIFDDRVQQLRELGMGINAIARELGVASSMVRMSIELPEKEYTMIQKHKNYGERMDWATIDKATLPLVKQAISDLKGDGRIKPHKISMYAVGKRLNISVSRLQQMELCKREIMISRDSEEKYAARRIIWAVNKLKMEKKPILFWRLTYLTKLEKEEMEHCLPQLEVMDSNIAEMVRAIV